MNGSMASMQMYSEQIRNGKQADTLVLLPPLAQGAEEHPCAGWCWKATGKAGSSLGCPASITSIHVAELDTVPEPRCSCWKKLLHSLESLLLGGALERRRRAGMMWVCGFAHLPTASSCSELHVVNK